MKKLHDKYNERENTRTLLLTERSTLAAKKSDRDSLIAEIEVLIENIKRLQTRFVEQTSEVRQLLHADLAGIVTARQEQGAAVDGDGNLVRGRFEDAIDKNGTVSGQIFIPDPPDEKFEERRTAAERSP